jgi:hypothetical protein
MTHNVSSRSQLKRQNFNISPEQEAEISWLREAIDAPTTKDAILRAVRVMTLLAKEAQHGRTLYVGDNTGTPDRLLIPELESLIPFPYKFLTERPHPWRRQLWVKGRRLLASTVWADVIANGMSKEEAAENWELPVESIQEILLYCERNRELLAMEADEEKRLLRAKGISFDNQKTRS